MRKVFSADKVFTGSSLLNDRAVICEKDVVIDIVPLGSFPEDVQVVNHFPIIAPPLIDIQVYGASSKLFSVSPTADTLCKMHEYCKSGGATYFVPTISTNTVDVLQKGIAAIKEYWTGGGKGVIGLHVEGPWINSLKRGAHLESLIRQPQLEEVKSLLEFGKGVIKMITLAPEVCSDEVLALIRSYGIVISAGHSNAGYEEAWQAFDKGINVATHLFNAMTALHHREPGLAAAIMMHPTVMCSIVPDGVHVDFAMVKLAKKVMGERLFIITDAVTETNEGPYQHTLDVNRYQTYGILSGSALTMIAGVKNLVEHCGIPLEEALKMASIYPAKVIGMDHKVARIEAGRTAELLFLSEGLDVIDF